MLSAKTIFARFAVLAFALTAVGQVEAANKKIITTTTTTVVSDPSASAGASAKRAKKKVAHRSVKNAKKKKAKLKSASMSTRSRSVHTTHVTRTTRTQLAGRAATPSELAGAQVSSSTLVANSTSSKSSAKSALNSTNVNSSSSAMFGSSNLTGSASDPKVPGATSSLTAQTSAPAPAAGWTGSYLGSLHGGSVLYPGSAYIPDLDNPGYISDNRINIENYFSLGYKPDALSKVSVLLFGLWTPVRDQDWTWGDPNLVYGRNEVIKAGNYSLGGDLRASIPITEGSRKNHLVTALRSTQVQSYAFNGTPWTLGLKTVIIGKIYSEVPGDSEANLPEGLVFVASPGIDYQLNETVALNASFEGAWHNLVGDGIGNFTNLGTIVDLGVGWDITPTLNFSPYIEFPTSNRVTSVTTTFGAVVLWKFL